MQKKMYKNHTCGLVTSLDMIICLSIGEKHNYLTKFDENYEEIQRERMKEK